MIPSLTALPDNIDALKALLVAECQARTQAEETAKDERGRADLLDRLVQELRRALFGRRSERIAPDQLQLMLEDLEGAIAQIEADAPAPAPARPVPKRNTNRGNLPGHLPHIEQVIEPETKVCACGGELHRIGEDRSERLDVIPAQFRVLVTVRPRYGCRTCAGQVVQASAPARLIPGGIPTEGLVAHLLVGKYADHLPLYRQAQIFARQGIDLDRSTLADWVGRAAFELKPIFERLVVHLKGSTKLFMDETRAPVLDPGRGKTKTGYLWALARDDRPWGGGDPPGVAYFYAPGRGGLHADGFLNGFTGTLQVDGYGGYNRLKNPERPDGALQLAYCWAHARRKFYEIAQSGTAPQAEEGLRRIAELYRIEDEIRGRTPPVRSAVRQERSRPLIESLETWVDDLLRRVSNRSRLAEALRYMVKYRKGLALFLKDGRVEMDNNTVERSIRPIALSRKNALFAGHDEGARNWGRIASLIETCKLNDVNPQAYLHTTLSRILDGHLQSKVDDLMPWAFKNQNVNVA